MTSHNLHMTMTDVRNLPWNGFNVVSTFSGCGGSCLGYRMAGFKVRWANEFIPEAQQTYRLNHTESFLNTQDIREVTAKQIEEQSGIKGREIDIFDGSPPCSSFSTIGKREEGWGKVKNYSGKVQRTDNLFFEYIRLISELQPKTFVAENVVGLIRGTAKGYFIDIFRALKEAGYQVDAKVLDASWLGAATSRQRVIFVGVRNDLKKMPVFPKPFGTQISFLKATQGITKGSPDCKEVNWFKSDSKLKTYWEHTKQGQSFDDAALKVTGTAKAFQWVKIDPRKPIPTIVQGSQCLTHYLEPRTLSIAEIKACSGFPKDFHLAGNFSQKWERIGRAVPPPLMKAVANAVAVNVLGKITSK